MPFPIPLTEGTSGESVSVRPSRSVARLVETIVGGDTGWTLGGVTVGVDEEGHDEGGNVELAWLEQGTQNSGSRQFSTMDSGARGTLGALTGNTGSYIPTPAPGEAVLLPSRTQKCVPSASPAPEPWAT